MTLADCTQDFNFDGDGWDECDGDELASISTRQSLSALKSTPWKHFQPPIVPKPAPPAPAAKKRGKSKAETNDNEKKCNCCDETLPLSSFKEARAICAECDWATESLQRLLRKKWKKDYKVKWAKAKKDKQKLSRGIVAFRAANSGNKKRALNGGKDKFLERDHRAKTNIRRRATRKMAWNQFKAYYESEDHGGYPPEALRRKWCKVQEDAGAPCDTKGVVAGVGGHPRYRVELEDGDESISESEEAKIREHQKGSKEVEGMSIDDIVDFLAGNAELDLDDDAALPPEFDSDEDFFF